MKFDKRLMLSIVYILLGFFLNILVWIGNLDEYWSGFSCGFIGVGVVQLIRHIRYIKNEGYREKMDIESKDERNRYLSNKAWAWAGYIFIIISVVISVIFKLLKFDEMSTMLSINVCSIVLIYVVAYFVLKRKY